MTHDRTPFTPISRDWRARAAVYASVIVSYVAAVQNDPLMPSMIFIFAAAGLWSLACEHRFLKPFFPSALKIGLIVTGSAVFIAFFLGGLTRPPEAFANAIARFLFWNAIVFVLSRNKTEYDVWTLGIIDVSLFMIAGAFVQPAGFVPLFIVALTCTLYTFQRLALLRCGHIGEQARHGPGIVTTHVLLVLEMAVCVFLFFPRSVFPARALARAAAGTVKPDVAFPDIELRDRRERRTGQPPNPNELTLDSMAQLMIDRSTVMRLKVTPTAPDSRFAVGQHFYLRGAVFERYERGKWIAAYAATDADAGTDGWVAADPDVRLRDEVLQHVIAGSGDGELVYAMGEPLRLKAPAAKYDAMGVFFFSAPRTGNIEYEVVSAYVPDAGQDLRSLPPRQRQQYRSVPAGMERLRRTAREIAGHRENAYDKAAAIQQWLLKDGGFRYRLGGIVVPDGVDSLDHFLFGPEREGYCMHFATAMTLMCRAVDVPARFAAGYHVDDYDIIKKEYVVRNSDAHAWVEIGWPGRGWMRFDPTPADESRSNTPPENPPVPTVDDRHREAEEERKKLEEDAARRWDHFLVDYDPSSQTTAAQAIARTVAAALGTAGRLLTSTVLIVTFAIAAAGVLLAYALLPRRGRARLRQIFGGFKQRSTVPFYRDFLWLAARKGVHKPEGLTGREFAPMAAAHLPADAVALVTEKFYEAKFAGRALTANDAALVREALVAIDEWQPDRDRASRP